MKSENQSSSWVEENAEKLDDMDCRPEKKESPYSEKMEKELKEKYSGNQNKFVILL